MGTESQEAVGCSLKEVLSREPSFNRWQRLAVGKWRGSERRSHSRTNYAVSREDSGFLGGGGASLSLSRLPTLQFCHIPAKIQTEVLSLSLQQMAATPRT